MNLEIGKHVHRRLFSDRNMRKVPYIRLWEKVREESFI